MSKSKTLIKEITVNPFRVEMWLVITDQPHFECSKLNQKHKGLNLKWPDDAAAITEVNLYKGTFMPVVFDATQGFDVGTLTHEIVHIVNVVYKHADVKHDPDNDEWDAYLFGWLADEIYKAWMEYRKMK